MKDPSMMQLDDKLLEGCYIGTAAHKSSYICIYMSILLKSESWGSQTNHESAMM